MQNMKALRFFIVILVIFMLFLSFLLQTRMKNFDGYHFLCIFWRGKRWQSSKFEKMTNNVFFSNFFDFFSSTSGLTSGFVTMRFNMVKFTTRHWKADALSFNLTTRSPQIDFIKKVWIGCLTSGRMTHIYILLYINKNILIYQILKLLC